MTHQTDSRGGGRGAPARHFQAFPLFLRANTQLQGLTFSLLPWGSPGLCAAVGLTASVTQGPLLVLAYEWPVPWLRTTRLRKTEIEAIHLHRFGTDHRPGLGQLPFSETTLGSNPPD
jgi:hypothetical protein